MRLAVATAVCLAVIGVSVACEVDAAIKKPTDIPAQRLDRALQVLAKDRGLAMAYRSEVVGETQTAGATGDLTRDEALTQLLSGTGLGYQFLDANTVTIVPAPTGPEAVAVYASPSAVDTQPAAQAVTAEKPKEEPRTFLERFRLARVDQGTSSAYSSVAKPSEQRFEKKPEQLEEVIVTAQKRKEILRDVPESITVVSTETLERQQAHGFRDYIGLIPGLSLQGDTQGADHLTLRGINSGSGGATVAVYLDDVPYGSSSGLANGNILAGDFDTLDIDRLEVLRGPQGTLYGAASLGGVLKFVTKAPQTQGFDANVQSGFESVSGGAPGYSGSGMVNIPLGERFAVRASGFYRRQGGYVDSTDTPLFAADGTTVIERASGRHNINDTIVYGGRISALLEATDALSVRLTALLQNIEAAATGLVEADPITLQPLNGELRYSQFHADTTDTQYRVYSATVNWNLGFGSLVSSSSYATVDALTILDLALGADQVLTDAFGRPLSAVQNGNIGTNKTTEELRLSSAGNDRFEWLVGGFFTRENSVIAQQQVTVEAGTETISTDIPTLVAANLASSYQEYALFTNNTWHAAPRFDLTLGSRVSRNKQREDLLESGLLIGPTVAIDNLRSAENVFTYSVAPRFKLSDSASLYARVATGYRPGGPNVVPPNPPPGTPITYRSDRTINYEAGLKADWLDRKLSFDAAAYYIDWKDIQLFTIINQTGLNENGGTATSKGLEFTAALRPVKELTLTLNGAYTDAYLTQDTPAITDGFNGDPLPYVPKWGFNLSGDYEYAVLAGTKAYIGSTARYVGRQTTEFLDRTAAGSLYQLPTYTLIDLRAGLRTDRWSIDAYARNVGNKRGITSLFEGIVPNGALATGIVRPRTIGLTLGVQF